MNGFDFNRQPFFRPFLQNVSSLQKFWFSPLYVAPQMACVRQDTADEAAKRKKKDKMKQEKDAKFDI
jgi:hypothetical protein